jgi:hypothetical protein
MTKDIRCRLVFWTLFAAYVVYLLGLASVAHLVRGNLWSSTATKYVWYSLASAAVAVGCWIALGDGSGLVRLTVGLWGLVCTWIVWQASIYISAIYQPGQPGSTSEGFTVYATGNAIIALVVTVALVGLTRVTSGLRLVRDPKMGPLIPTRRWFTLAEFLCGVAICATTLGAARLVAPHDLTYFTWFTLPKEVLGFFWGWACTAVIAIPAALMLVYSKKPVWAVCFFFVAITAIVVQQRWEGVGRMRFSAWRFYWLLEALRVFQVVAHVAALLLVLKWLGYSLARAIWATSLVGQPESTLPGSRRR